MKAFTKVGLLLVLSAGMLISCGNKKESPDQTIISTQDGEIVLSNEATSDGLVYERDMDGEGFSIKDYVGNSTNVVIPDKFEGKPVKRIQSLAFRNKNLIKLSIPGTVEEIDDYAFIENKDLAEIEVKGKNFYVKNNALYKKVFVQNEKGKQVEKKHLVLVMPHLKGQYVVNEDVLAIVKGAFQSTGLTIVNMNADLIKGHFQDLFGIASDSIPNNMKQVVLTGGNVADYAFTGVKALSSLVVYDPVETIGEKAFFGCSELTSVLIPDSLTTIGKKAFAGCAKLQEVRIGNTEAPKLKTLGEGAFLGCSKIISTIKAGVKYIGNPNAQFLICLEADDTKITNLSFDQSTKFICDEAFKNCVKLETITFNNVASIGNLAFQNCMSLEEVSLPNSLVTLGNRVFEGTKILTGDSKVIENGGIYIKTKAGDRALIDVDPEASKLRVHTDTKWIDTYALNVHPSKLEKFESSSELFDTSSDFKVLTDSKYKVAYASTKMSVIEAEDTPDLNKIVEVKDYAFAGATYNGYVLPSTLKYVGEHAFENFTEKDPSNYQLALGENVLSVGEDAFKGVKGYTEVVLNDGLLVLDKGALSASTTLVGELYLPLSLTYVGANLFTGTNFGAIKVAANETPASWDAGWLGAYDAENVIYGASR